MIGALAAAAWTFREELIDATSLKKNGRGSKAAPADVAKAEYDRPISQADIVDAVADSEWVLIYGTSDDAAEYSRGCFAELRAYPSLRLLDRCIAFDFAWKHQLRVSGGRNAFFADEPMRQRHFRYAAAVPGGEAMNEARLNSLEALTIATLAAMASAGRRTPRD